MNKIVLSIALFLIATQCAMSQVVNQRIVDANGREQLLGQVTKEALSSPPWSNWYVKRVDEYVPDRQILKQIENLDDFEIEIFFGTACGDSQREVPRFVKTLDELGFPDSRLSIIGVNFTKDQYKQSPNGEGAGKKIFRTPTFIIRKDGKEINRIVESPIVSLEQDILTIISGQQYTPNYPIVAEMARMLEDKGHATISAEADSIARRLEPNAKRPTGLASYGYLHLNRQNIGAAVAVFEVSRRIHSDEFIVYKGLAEAYFELGNHDKAEVNYLKALELSPDDEDILRALDETRARQ